MDIEEKMEVDVVTSFVMVKCEPQLNEDSNISEPEAAMPVKVKQSEFKQDDELQPWDLSTVKQEQQEEEGVGGSAKFSRTCDTCSKTVCECRTQHDKPYLCNTCGKAFKTNAYLGEHKRIHTGEKPYKCDACSAAFAQRQSLLKHRHTHSGEKPCECKVCGKAFRTSYISEHRRVHTGEKPHKCKLCFSTFTRRQSLVKHTRIHTGEKPFMCETCGKSFTQRPHLKTHERIHNRDKTLWV